MAPHKETLASMASNYSMGHLFSTPLWVWVGPAHKRTIQGLQTSRQTAPVPRSACLLSAPTREGLRAEHMKLLWPPEERPDEVNAVRIQLQWGDYILVHRYCRLALLWTLLSSTPDGYKSKYLHSIVFFNQVAVYLSNVEGLHKKGKTCKVEWLQPSFIHRLQTGSVSLMMEAWKYLQGHFFSDKDGKTILMPALSGGSSFIL